MDKETMSDAEGIASRIMAIPEERRSGTLRTYGVWFGRPMDNVHTVRGIEARAGEIVLIFDQGERLAIRYPSGLAIERKSFRIDSASSVRWEWVPYGSSPGTDREWREFHRTDDGVAVTHSGGFTIEGRPDSAAPAVELIGL